VKQGVAEWYRLQLKEKIRKGLQEHHLAGWNTGPVRYGYAADRHPHPNPMKAGMGLTRHKLAADPDTAGWVPRIFEWRILDHLALTAIARRLDEAGAPRPGGRRWSGSTVDAILKNPKYPGHVHARLADKVLTKVIAGVLDQRVFGLDRAAMLTAQLPATAAEKTADRDRQAAALRQQLKKIDTSGSATATASAQPPSSS
jgi:hypothetical protein